MMVKNPFLDAVEAFLVQHGMNATTFGLLAMKDGKFVFLLRDGRDTRRSTEAKVMKFMTEYKPKKTNLIFKEKARA